VVYIKLSVEAKDCSGRKLSEHSPFAQQSTYRQRMSAPEFQKLNGGPWAHGKVQCHSFRRGDKMATSFFRSS
jgi:hypothetical protein